MTPPAKPSVGDPVSYMTDDDDEVQEATIEKVEATNLDGTHKITFTNDDGEPITIDVYYNVGEGGWMQVGVDVDEEEPE